MQFGSLKAFATAKWCSLDARFWINRMFKKINMKKVLTIVKFYCKISKH